MEECPWRWENLGDEEESVEEVPGIRGALLIRENALGDEARG